MEDNKKYYKVGYIISTLLDFGLTFGGSGAIIVMNYIDPNNSSAFKISLSGIILVIALLLTAKAIFEHSFQSKQNTLLQQLATADSQELKDEINKKIDEHKMTSYIYQRLMILLPFAILSVVTNLGAIALQELNGTVNMILACMGAGSVFNVIKKPLKEKADMQKLRSKAKKK